MSSLFVQPETKLKLEQNLSGTLFPLINLSF